MVMPFLAGGGVACELMPVTSASPRSPSGILKPLPCSAACWFLADTAALVRKRRFPRRITEENSHYTEQAMRTPNGEIFVKSVSENRDKKEIVVPGLVIFANLTAIFSERSVLIEQDVRG